MRKYAILLVLTAFVVAFTSGCDLIVKDEEVDAQTVIIEVAGTTIVKSEVEQAVQNYMDYQEYLYSMYGMSYDTTDSDHIEAAQESAMDSLIEEAVIKQKIQEYGLDQFTDDELAAINETVDENYDSYLSSVQSYYFADSELTGDELAAAVEEKLLELGYSKDEMLEEEKLSESTDKLKEEIVKDVAVTDEEIETEYNTNLETAMETYASDLTQYASDVNSGDIIYYVPDGYRYVKNLLVKISDEDSDTIDSLTAQIADDQDSLQSTQDAIDELTSGTDEDTETNDEQAENDAKSLEELSMQAEALTEEIDDLTTQLETTTENAYAAIQPTIDEIVAKLDAGEDFDTLMEEYGEDSGMKSEPTKSTGYLLCDGLTTYVDEFMDAAMALKKVGDVSDPFRTDYGIHIVEYASDLASGDVALDDIRDDIEAELLTDKQDTLYDETVAQWVTDANAKTYPNRLDD
ncbi:MAG TPA: peptidylprolyl isomerase [Candidatus Limiplasma sp.]|nr:peptidylprolyl isomerase [Candidatus Limiplasma sp.]